MSTETPFKLKPTFVFGRQPEFAALGRFVAGCSYIEVSLQSTLKHFLALEDNLARMFVGELSIVDLSLKLRTVLSTRAEPYAIPYDPVHQQITYINEVRRWVAHKPFQTISGAMFFTNLITAKSEASIKDYECTAAQLVNMADYTTHVSDTVSRLKPQRASTPAKYRQCVAELLASAKRLDLPSSPDRIEKKRSEPSNLREIPVARHPV